MGSVKNGLCKECWGGRYSKYFRASLFLKNHCISAIFQWMQHFGCKYPPEQDCYGARFSDWLRSPTPAPYNCFGNGSAMRVSPCPQAIIAFLESHSFEDAVRNAVSMGGDSDTIGAIAGSIAWAYYYDRRDDTF